MSSVPSNSASRAPARHPMLMRLHRAMVACAAMSIGLLAGLSSLPAQSAVAIPQSPLSLGTPVPGNLVLTPSVEFPTVYSQANLGGFNAARNYIGYFDARLCYAYRFDAIEANRCSRPTAMQTPNRACAT